MKELYLLRHGDIGGRNRYIGATDLGLSERGTVQIRNVAPSLRDIPFDAVFCSPMRRCLQSHELLQLSQSPEIQEDLREINFGRWEQKTFAEISATDPSLVQKWADNPDDFSFPGGESLANFNSRIARMMSHITNAQAEKILMVTHGGVIRHLLCLLLHLPLANYLLFQVKTGSYSTVELYDSGGILTGLNLR